MYNVLPRLKLAMFFKTYCEVIIDIIFTSHEAFLILNNVILSSCRSSRAAMLANLPLKWKRIKGGIIQYENAPLPPLTTMKSRKKDSDMDVFALQMQNL